MIGRKKWLEEHHKDPYVLRARKEGYVSRAAYKLLEIQEKDHIIKPGMAVLDLGAAPGGWLQVTQSILGAKGRLVAVDLLALTVTLSDVTFIQGDFRDNEVWAALTDSLGERGAHVVLSDMSPNMIGHKQTDQARFMQLIEDAWDVTQYILQPGGAFVSKVFQGAHVDNFIRLMRSHFAQVKIRKPDSSRGRSREFYLVASGYRGKLG